MGGGYQTSGAVPSGLDDLLGLGSEGLLGDIAGTASPPTVAGYGNPAPAPSTLMGLGGLGDVFATGGLAAGGGASYVPPKAVSTRIQYTLSMCLSD